MAALFAWAGVPKGLVAQGPAAATSEIVVGLTPAGPTTTVTKRGQGKAHYAPSRVIVRFRSGTTFLPGSEGTKALSPSANIHVAGIPSGLSVADAIARYTQDPNVLYAEPDYTVAADVTPNDPAFGPKQWDMAKIASGAAWDLHTDSSGIVTAVVDTGIDYNHPDLADNLYTDAASPTVHGYTCIGGACVVGGQDDNGHGTHVAGTIGASTGNGVGVAGLNWRVELLSIKFLGADGSGSVSDAILGFNLLRALKQKGVNIRVVNNSWSGGGYSQALKDAMAALEDTPGYPSTLDVCAAGNSSLNNDFSATYPAAYNNPAIISVLASDVNDLGGSFSNYGLATVDIAAPGVSIYSTVPTGTCMLCDPSGYATLSGTSMASPHVAGVAAALMDMNPSLTATQIRDLLLHPNSYDAVTDLRASSTSTGGRLNYFKAMTNASFILNPVLNRFPTLSIGPDVFATAGTTVNLTASGVDPDGDPLRSTRGKGPVNMGSAWLFGWRAAQLFPNAAPFSAPAVARLIAMPYDTSVADNRGGGTSARNWVVVSASTTPGGVPTGTLKVPATASVGSAVTVSFTGLDPEGSVVGWDLSAAGRGSSSLNCCYTGTSASLTFSTAGVYRVGVHAIDRELNLSRDYTAVISVGGASGIPPIADAVLSATSGTAPLTVNVDMKGSADPDGTIAAYYLDCANGSVVSSTSSAGSCTFTSPGVYWLLLQVQDNSGFMGLTSRYVVVTPTPPADTTAPTVNITSPASGATAVGTTSLQSNAADNKGGSGVKEVEYYLDTVSTTTSLGKSAVSPYTVSWNADAATVGSHNILAIARDNAGNASAKATLPVNVARLVLPTVTLSPSGTYTVAKKGKLNLTATTNAPTYGIARVDFVVSGKVVGKALASPYTFTWTAPSSAVTTTATAIAYDTNGNSASSNVLTIIVK